MDRTEAAISEFVVPFYLDFLNGNFLRYTRQAEISAERIQFESKFRRALDSINPSDVEILLADDGWRPQLMSSWYCAAKGWHQFSERLGSSLMNDRSGYAAQGYCIALYSFADDTSVAYLCKYLDEWLNREEVRHQPDVMQTLLFLDEKLASTHSARYSGADGVWEKWIAGDAQRSKTNMAALLLGLQYVHNIATNPIKYSDDAISESLRECSGCHKLLERTQKHCTSCGRIDI